jgi:hypothetical protein
MNTARVRFRQLLAAIAMITVTYFASQELRAADPETGICQPVFIGIWPIGKWACKNVSCPAPCPPTPLDVAGIMSCPCK